MNRITAYIGPRYEKSMHSLKKEKREENWINEMTKLRRELFEDGFFLMNGDNERSPISEPFYTPRIIQSLQGEPN